jgi:hypothetical protein
MKSAGQKGAIVSQKRFIKKVSCPRIVTATESHAGTRIRARTAGPMHKAARRARTPDLQT